MAFFSVLSFPEGGSYDILRAHVNVWSLNGLLGHRPMIFDVGLLMRGGTAATRQVQVCLPVKAAPPVRDLAAELRDHRVAQLIFDRAYHGTEPPNRLRLTLEPEGDLNVAVIGVDTNRTKLVEEDSDDALSVFSIVLAEELEPGQLGYMRFRIPCDHGGVMWRWKRVLGRRNGVLIDFRSPDARESGDPQGRPALQPRAKDLPRLDVFMILSEDYQLRAATPALARTRTLEGAAWEPYLRRSAGTRRKRAMVHQWSKTPVTRADPFRAYMQMNRVPGFHAVTDLLIVGLLSAGAVWALLEPTSVRSWLEDAVTVAASSLTATVLAYVAGVTMLGWLALLVAGPRRLRHARAVVVAVKRWLKRREYTFYKMLRSR